MFYVVLRALYDDGSSHTWTNVPRFYLAFWPPSCQACPREMAGGPWAMRTRSGRCLVFAMRTASDYLPRLARAARRVQGPRSGPFRKLGTVA